MKLSDYGNMYASYIYKINSFGNIEKMEFCDFDPDEELMTSHTFKRIARNIYDYHIIDWRKMLENDWEMRIGLNIFDYDRSDLIEDEHIYSCSYESAAEKDDERYYIKYNSGDGNIFTFGFDKERIAVVNKNMHTIKSFYSENGLIDDFTSPIETIWVLLYGICVIENYIDNTGYVIKNHEEAEIYYFEKSDKSYSSYIYTGINTGYKDYTVESEEHGMILTIKDKEGNLYSRYECYNEGKTNYMRSIHPMVSCEITWMHALPFRSFWEAEEIQYDSNHNPCLYTRNIYKIENDQQLLDIIRDNTNKLILEGE